MSKAKIEIEGLIAATQETREMVKEETHQQIEALETQCHKHLFESKHECLIEVADAIVLGVAKFATIDKNNISHGSLRAKIQKFMERIASNIEDIEDMLLTRGDSNEAAKGDYNRVNLNSWKARLQNNIDKIIDIYEQPWNPSKYTLVIESEYGSLLQQKIKEEVAATTQFFQSIKRVEDKEINKYFNREVKKAEEDFIKTLRQINDDLAEQIGGLILNPVTAEVANINLNADNKVSDENAGCQDLTLVGDGSLEPA